MPAIDPLLMLRKQPLVDTTHDPHFNGEPMHSSAVNKVHFDFLGNKSVQQQNRSTKPYYAGRFRLYLPYEDVFGCC